MRQWRLIYDAPTNGARNMAADEAILLSGHAVPTLRLYAWSPPCLSLGYGQQVKAVDFQRLTARGWEMVRRPTGGRAVLHVDELTYSLMLPAEHPLTAGSVIECCRRISAGLMAGLRYMGVQAQALPGQGESGAGAVCFETPSHYEITVDGRKLVGSAQVRRKEGLLQHGSLPLGGDITRICDVLALSDENQRQQCRDQVRRRATTLAAALDVEAVEWQRAAQAVAAGFQEVFGIDFIRAVLSDEERLLCEKLVHEKYQDSRLLFRR